MCMICQYASIVFESLIHYRTYAPPPHPLSYTQTSAPHHNDDHQEKRCTLTHLYRQTRTPLHTHPPPPPPPPIHRAPTYTAALQGTAAVGTTTTSTWSSTTRPDRHRDGPIPPPPPPPPLPPASSVLPQSTGDGLPLPGPPASPHADHPYWKTTRRRRGAAEDPSRPGGTQEAEGLAAYSTYRQVLGFYPQMWESRWSFILMLEACECDCESIKDTPIGES